MFNAPAISEWRNHAVNSFNINSLLLLLLALYFNCTFVNVNGCCCCNWLCISYYWLTDWLSGSFPLQWHSNHSFIVEKSANNHGIENVLDKVSVVQRVECKRSAKVVGRPLNFKIKWKYKNQTSQAAPPPEQLLVRPSFGWLCKVFWCWCCVVHLYHLCFANAKSQENTRDNNNSASTQQTWKPHQQPTTTQSNHCNRNSSTEMFC